jgi:hypothetical protein
VLREDIQADDLLVPGAGRARAQLELLIVEKESFFERADPLKHLRAYEHTSAMQPVGHDHVVSRAPRRNWAAKAEERPRQRASRFADLHEARTDQPNASIGVQHVGQLVERSFG